MKAFRPQAVVFDMDGLLLETERLAMATFLDACRLHGYEPDPAVYLRCVGTREERTREILREGYGAAFPIDAVTQSWWAQYHEHVLHRPVDAKPGARSLLERLAVLRVPLAVATSTGTELAIRKLTLAGFAPFFRHVVGGDQVQRAKPDPEPYREAARRLGAPVHVCWAIEDSENGVRAAHAAGLFVVQVPDLVPPSAALRALNHPIFASLTDVEHMLAATLEPSTT